MFSLDYKTLKKVFNYYYYVLSKSTCLKDFVSHLVSIGIYVVHPSEKQN